MHDDDMDHASDFTTPAELGQELGHNDGDRPGITVRRYLRERYLEHPKNQQWRLSPDEADDVRRHFGGRRSFASDEQRSETSERPPVADWTASADSSSTFLPDLSAAAVDALTGERWAITDAVQHVPPRPGLYAIYGDEQAWRDLQLEPAPNQPLYVGKAEESLVSRDLNGHFATNPNSKPRTGGSTVRRSFAALLREALNLHAVPRNLARPERFSNYGLAEGGDARLNEWMHARLTLAVWPAPADMPAPLGEVETAVIVRFTPPINLDKNPGKLARLSAARAEMAAEASRWRPET